MCTKQSKARIKCKRQWQLKEQRANTPNRQASNLALLCVK